MMSGDFKAALWVDKVSIDMNDFVEQFVARTVAGAVSSLKGADDVRIMELHLEKGNLSISVNGQEMSLSPFPSRIITNTVVALVSSLKGADKVNELRITVQSK